MSKPKTLVTRFKIRDTILVVIFSLFLFSPLIFLGVQKVAHVEFPSWLTSESMKYLEGKNSDVGLKSSISIKGFMNGKLQSGIESKIGNYIPAKSTALLQNASLQRMFIKASNDVFGWDWYPTYYDSDCVSHKDNDLLVTPIAKKTEKAAKGLERTASYYSEIATKHPDIKFYICMPSSGLHSMLLNDLRSDPIDPDFVKEHFFDKLTNKISVVDISINDVDDYKKQYFKTDHHWQIEGAYRAYSLIAQEMGISDALKIHGGGHSYNANYFGSQARTGLDTWTGSDDIRDYDFDLPEFEVYKGLKRTKQSDPVDFVCSMQKFSNDDYSKEDFQLQYANYFHTDIPFFEMSVVNPENNDRSLLIAGDSFTNNMERLFLNDFDKVYSYNFKMENKESFADFLDGLENVDSVLIMQSFGNLAKWKK